MVGNIKRLLEINYYMSYKDIGKLFIDEYRKYNDWTIDLSKIKDLKLSLVRNNNGIQEVINCRIAVLFRCRADGIITDKEMFDLGLK